MTVKNLTFWAIAQYNNETDAKINVDEALIIVSKAGKLWTSSESAKNIDPLLFKSIDGVP